MTAAGRLLEIYTALSDELHVPEDALLIKHAAPLVWAHEQLQAQLLVDRLPTADFIVITKELAAIDAQLIELKALAPSPITVNVKYVHGTSECLACGHVQPDPLPPPAPKLLTGPRAEVHPAPPEVRRTSEARKPGAIPPMGGEFWPDPSGTGSGATPDHLVDPKLRRRDFKGPERGDEPWRGQIEPNRR